MGTRADFYVRRDTTDPNDWIGSIAWNGCPDGIDARIFCCQTEESFREAVQDFLKRNDATLPEQGWPWPWDDSNTTDYAYALDIGREIPKVVASNGYFWFDPLCDEPDEDLYPHMWKKRSCIFPDMSSRKIVARGERSGLISFGGF